VVYAAAEIVSPGRIAHIKGDRFTLGEPDGSKSERVTALSSAMSAAGLKAPVKADIRTEIWVKLWGNAAFNPISALTDATLKASCEDPLTRDLAATAMTEVEQIAKALGVRMPVSLDCRIAGAAAIGNTRLRCFRTWDGGGR
jgi:2-dehydropantoate 2-reductase